MTSKMIRKEFIKRRINVILAKEGGSYIFVHKNRISKVYSGNGYVNKLWCLDLGEWCRLAKEFCK